MFPETLRDDSKIQYKQHKERRVQRHQQLKIILRLTSVPYYHDVGRRAALGWLRSVKEKEFHFCDCER